MASVARVASGGGGVQPGSAPGPGEAVRPQLLRERWARMEGHPGVLGFYGHSRGEYRCFSNFFDQSSSPFDFQVPPSFLAGLGRQRHSVLEVVPCAFSEKAIMLCKAAVMGDAEVYMQIACASNPGQTKALGRKVRGFSPQLWDDVVCSVAFEVVFQKFSKTPSLQRTLLHTGDMLIAEATANDANWGIGINTGDPRVQTPAAWEGSNFLGWALMETRTALRRGKQVPQGKGQETRTALWHSKQVPQDKGQEVIDLDKFPSLPTAAAADGKAVVAAPARGSKSRWKSRAE
mmetsp:Transcript_9066/g.28860  ORF Transcript_9066/g.28860 Transcript_9066/m.28860 type:complete len:290 (+) Transcript_9066:68-937(+)